MDIHEANRERLPKGIQEVPSTEWAILKNKILSCFESADMKTYLAEYAAHQEYKRRTT